MSSTDSSKKGSGSSGRRVDNMGPILMSPGGTFKVPPQNIFNPANAATATPPSRSPSKASRSVDLEGGVAALERLLEIPDLALDSLWRDLAGAARRAGRWPAGFVAAIQRCAFATPGGES